MQKITIAEQDNYFRLKRSIIDLIEEMALEWAKIYGLKRSNPNTTDGDFDYIKVHMGVPYYYFNLLCRGFGGDGPSELDLCYPKKESFLCGDYIEYVYPNITREDLEQPDKWLDKQKEEFQKLKDKWGKLQELQKPKVLASKKEEIKALQKEIQELENEG